MDENVGVLLLQMGGPRTLDEVEPTIEALFRDPDLVRLPWPISWFRKPLARRVAKRRAPEVRKQYELMGGGSPNNATTMAQAQVLEKALGDGFSCYAAMAYTPPTIAEALQKALADGCTKIVGLSMFPQYSTATTKAAFRDLREAAQQQGVDWNSILLIDRWSAEQDYLGLAHSWIQSSLQQGTQTEESPVLLISAHGIPVSYVKSGDPYQKEVEAMVANLKKLLPRKQRVELSYQSRATKEPWLAPSTEHKLEELGREGVKSVLVFAASFVHDHIETLVELDVDLAKVAHRFGIEKYSRVPAFNAHSDLAEVLAGLVRRRVAP